MPRWRHEGFTRHQPIQGRLWEQEAKNCAEAERSYPNGKSPECVGQSPVGTWRLGTTGGGGNGRCCGKWSSPDGGGPGRLGGGGSFPESNTASSPNLCHAGRLGKREGSYVIQVGTCGFGAGLERQLEFGKRKKGKFFPWPWRTGQTCDSRTYRVLESFALVELSHYFRT